MSFRPSRSMLAAAAAVALLASGCLSSSLPTLTTSTTSPPPTAFTRIVTVIDPEGGDGEPSLGVAPDGTLFATGLGAGFPRASPARIGDADVYQSTDGGATWTALNVPMQTPNFDSDLAVDADGTVWFDTLWIGCVAVAVSRDLGQTWDVNSAACNTAGSGDRQYVVPTRGGTAFLYSHQAPTLYQMAARTDDYGKTWVPTGLVEGAHLPLMGTFTGWGGGGFYNAATGSVFLTFTLHDDDGSHAGFAVTRDGMSWTLGRAGTLQGRQLGLGLVTGAADDAGNVYVAWGEDVDEQGHVAVFYAASSDDGQTWNPPVRVDDGFGSKVFPMVAAGAPGRLALAYYEADEDKYPSDVSGKGAWNVTLAWTHDALAAQPVVERATLSPGPVKKGPLCIDGTTCGGDREFLDYFALKRLPDGRVASVWNRLLPDDDQVLTVYGDTNERLLAAPSS